MHLDLNLVVSASKSYYILLPIPPSFFVDIYTLNSPHYYSGHFNLELPSAAFNHSAALLLNVSHSDPVHIPLHVRYPLPGTFELEIPTPIVFTASDVRLDSLESVSSNPSFTPLPFTFSPNGTISVPTGSPNDWPFVDIVTKLTVLILAIFVAKACMTTSKRLHTPKSKSE